MAELLDIVDKNDAVVGTTTREEAHAHSLPHRVAVIFVFNDSGMLLVQRRKKDGLLDHSSAGHVDTGETYDEAATRELKEELGLVCNLGKIGVFYADEQVPTRNLRIIHWFGLYETKPGDDTLSHMVLSEDEVVEMIPMHFEEIANAMRKEPEKFTVGFQFTLNFYIDKKALNIEKIQIQ